LINSPVVRADTLRFKEEGVRDVLKDVFLPWYNAFRFLLQNIFRLGKEDGVIFQYDEASVVPSDNYMDKWILSFTQSLVAFVQGEMAAYKLYTVVPRLVKFVDVLTNWYVRSNRKRMRGELGREECLRSLETLFGVIFTMVKMMAPFVPFLTELMYQKLRLLLDPEKPAYKGLDLRSVHFLPFPSPRKSLIEIKIEEAVAKMQTVIELGRVIRDRNTMPIKYPLKEVVVIMESAQALEDVQTLEGFIKDELNVKLLTTTTNKAKYGVKLQAQPDHKTLGLKLKGAFKAMIPKIQALNDSDLLRFQKSGFIDVDGYRLEHDDLRIFYSLEGDSNSTNGSGPTYSAHSEGEILVILDMSPDQSMIDEGIAREVVNRMQKLRKKGKLVPTDPVTIHWQTSDASLATLIAGHQSFIETSIKQPIRPMPAVGTVIVTETTQLKAASLELSIVSRNVAPEKASDPTSSRLSPSGRKPRTVSVHFAEPLPPVGPPVCDYVNLLTDDKKATLFLENPHGCRLDVRSLRTNLGLVFGFNPANVSIVEDQAKGHFKVLGTSNGKGTGLEQLAKRPREDPSCRFANICYIGGPERNGQFPCATLLLENPVGQRSIDLETLKVEIARVFGVHGGKKNLNFSLIQTRRQFLNLLKICTLKLSMYINN